ncbi:flagellar basal body-associated protein FliL [Amycolatopsis marina]|uniref:flagellar basal body-associated protein FliL n=1 Tax=Amycolatopsis marina TaxID=490629 RepID=UPI000B8A0625|nr:flagellar basal body-associated protein FliL [Amycolatopsis marina]
MAWQEELRKLDEDLASGNLSADEYRSRRDQILSSAVSSGEQPAQGNSAGPPADSTQIIQPVSPQQGQGQGPPSPPAGTPVDGGAERTQVVSNWQAQPPQQPPPSSPAGGFPAQHQHQQQGMGPASPAGGFAPPPHMQQGQQPWNAPQEDVSPPWGGSDFPPIAPPPRESEWVAQGPETFETKSSSGKGRKIAFSALAVVVLAGLGVAVWLLFIKDNGQESQPPAAQETSQQAPAPTSEPLPEPPAVKSEPKDLDSALVDPPGEERSGGGEFDLDKLAENKLLPEPMIAALKDADMSEGLLKTTADGDYIVGLFALTVKDAQAAATAAQAYAATQEEGGIPARPELSLQGVPVYGTGETAKKSVFRGVYVLYDKVIIVEQFGTDPADTRQKFEELLADQLELAPPTQRD